MSTTFRCRVPARIGLLGNPSDGYGGRTLAVAVDGMAATVELTVASGVAIEPGPDDRPEWRSIDGLVDRVDRDGLGTGTQLLTATVRTFCDVMDDLGRRRPDGFRLTYDTDIPRGVGLAGSSALVLAALSVLARHTGFEWPAHVLPPVALGVETGRMGIAAGLQDRVIQCRGGAVAMDFSELRGDARFGVHHGTDDPIDVDTLPPLFLGWYCDGAAPSGTYHRHLRAAHDAGDPEVRRGLRRLAALVGEGRAALRWGAYDRFGELVAENMAVRRTLAPVEPAQLAPIDALLAAGIPATFTGSGGAVAGVVPAGGLDVVAEAVAELGVEVRRVVPAAPHEGGIPVVEAVDVAPSP